MIRIKEVYQLRIYNPIQALDIFKDNKIKIYNWQKVDNDTYRFLINRKDNKKILELFNDIQYVKNIGLLARVINVFKSKTTLAGIITASLLFGVLSQRIFLIDIQGDANSLIPIVAKEVNSLGIKKLSGRKSLNKLQQIEYEALSNLKNEIEYIEIKQVGVKVKIRFQKRRTAPPLPEDRSSLYATKDGIIKAFDIKKGVIVVRINQYVKAGELLVNEKLMTTSGEEIHLGCQGQVFAYTWYRFQEKMTITDEHQYDETSNYLQLINMARNKIANELSEGEFIDSEKVLNFSRLGNEVILEVNYILVEDITI